MESRKGITTKKAAKPRQALPRSEKAFRELVELSSDWYWEQDENLRFTRFSGKKFSKTLDADGLIGKTPREAPGLVLALQIEAAERAGMDVREPFTDFEYVYTESDGSSRYITASGSPIFDASGRFRGYRGVAKDITERRRGEQLLALEHAVNRCLADAKNTSEGITAAIRAICETERWESGRFLRVDDRAGVLRMNEAWGIQNETIQRYLDSSRAVTYAPGAGLAGRVWQSGEPLWVADVGKDGCALRSSLYMQLGMRGAVYFPIMAEGKPIGMLAFNSREVREPDKRLLEAMRVIGSQIGQFVQRKEAEEALRESEKEATRIAQENAVVAEIGRVIGSTLNIDEVYEPFAQEARKLIPFDRLTVTIINPREGTFTSAYRSGIEIAARAEGSVFPLAGSTTELVIRKRSGVIVQEETERTLAERYPDLANILRGGVQSKMSVPLLAKDQVIGALHFRSKKKDAYSDRDLRLAEIIATQIAGAIANAQLFQERKQAEEALRTSEESAKRLAEENELVAEIGCIVSSTLNIEEVYEQFAEKVREIIPFDTISVNVANAKENTCTIQYVTGKEFEGRGVGDVIPLAGSMTGEAIRTRSSLLITTEDQEKLLRQYPHLLKTVQSGIRSMMLIPLLSKGEGIGCLYFRSTKPNAYSEQDVRLAERVGSQIAGAVANAQLFQERQRAEEALRTSEEAARRLAVENEIVAEIGRIVSLTLNIEEVYEQFAKKVYTLIPIDRITINLINSKDNTVTNAYISGTELSHRKKGTVYPLAFTISDEIRRTRASLLINEENYQNYAKKSPGLALSLQAGFRSMMAIPLISKDEVIGVLQFRSTEIKTYSEKDVFLAERVGRQIASAVANAQLFKELTQAEAVLRESEARFRSLTNLSSDWFWEQDENLRFIRFSGRRFTETHDAAKLLGKTRWEQTYLNMTEADWAAHRELLNAHKLFRDLELCLQDESGKTFWSSVSGEPILDDTGRFLGYRGVGKDITARKREERLLALEHAVNRCLADADNTSMAMKGVLRIVCETQNWECGRYFHRDKNADLLRFREFWTLPGSNLETFIARSRGITYSQGMGLVGRVWGSGKPLWMEDITKDVRVRPHGLSDGTGLHGTFMFPLMAEGQIVGVCTFLCREVREPDERLLEAIRVIGSQIGQFVQRKEAEEVLRESEERFRSLTNLSSDWFWEQDENLRFTRFSGKKFTKMYGGSELIGKTLWEQNFINMTEADWAAHIAVINTHSPFRDLELCQSDDSGNRLWSSISGEAIIDNEGRFLGYRGVGKDITERKLSEERIRYLATHDGLTDLPNRVLFSQLLNFKIKSARRYGGSFAVLFVDLDRFKIINDTLGHDAGDLFLQEIAERLKNCLRSSDVVARMDIGKPTESDDPSDDIVARLGGDEFVVLVQGVNEPEQVAVVARKILATIFKPVVLQEQECRVTTSIGISMYPKDAEDEQTLLKYADAAMYFAKEEGKNNFQFYSKAMRIQSLDRLTLEAGLRRALERCEVFLRYQAKLGVDRGASSGVETLLPSQHPDLGLLPPLKFLPMAEETGLIIPIGRWVLKTACAQNVAWQRAGLPPVCMAVNLSPRQFTDENLLNAVDAILLETGMAPQFLELEITESMVMGNVEQATMQLIALKQRGVRLAIDDFGTGYSSLAQIKRFPIDTIKVDRSFICKVPVDVENKAITEAIIAMGKSLNLTVVAEGVETEEQQAFLREHACDEMQGFYFSKPVPPGEFAELLRGHVPVPSRQP